MPKKKISAIDTLLYRIQGKAAVAFNEEWDKIPISTIAGVIPGLKFKSANNGKISAKCLFHDDSSDSAVIFPAGNGPAVYHCSSCGSATLFEVYAYSMHAENGGSATILACEDFGIPKKFAVVGVKNQAAKEKFGENVSNENSDSGDYGSDKKLKSGFTDPALTEDRLNELHNDLLLNQDAIDYIESEKGINLNTIQKYKIGLFNRGKGDIRYVYPIRDQLGKLINYRQYNPKRSPKYLGLDGIKADGIIPNVIETIDDNPIILVEGESDALCGRSFGLNTYSTTAGAGTFKDEWIKLFEGKDVGICYDNDQAGINGSIVVAEKLQPLAKSVKLMKQLSKKSGGDLVDFLVAENGTKQQIVNHYHNTPIFNGDTSLLESFVDVEFQELFHLKPSTRVRTKFKVIQIDSQLGLMSSRIKIDCKRGSKKVCNDCPAEGQDEFIVPITPQSIDYMQSHNITINKSHLKDLLRLHCSDIRGEFDNKYKIYHAAIHHPLTPFANVKSIDDCIVISDEYLDLSSPVMFESQIEIGQFPKSGGGLGIKTQTWFCFKPIPLPTLEESFSVDSELDYLTPFKSKPGYSELKSKMDHIYDDLESKLAIIGRRDMVTAADLCFVSAKEIEIQSGIFKDKFKGTIECAFFGDTRTGKTAAIERMSKLYRSGKLYDCANLSHAALIGMAHGNTNTTSAKFSLGILPKADGDLIVLDEADKYEGEGKFSKLTATRSSGIARYNKRDQSFSLPARVRIVWIANPPGGRVMTDYTFPFEVFLSVMKQQAAVSRFDFAISIVSREFKKQIIKDLGYYSIESYQKLALFSRSLKPEKIEITQSAIDLINDSTRDLFDTFGKDKGPVSNDIEEKLIRIATAIAVRVFSYDVLKEKLVVNEDHAQMAVHLMHALHSSPDVAYDKMHALERDLSTDMRDPEPFFDAIEYIPDNDARALFCQTVEENIGTAEFDRDELINMFPKKDYINGGHFFEKMLNSGAVYAKSNKEDGKITKIRYKFSRDGMLYMSAVRELGLESKRRVEERVKQMKSNQPEQQEMLDAI